MSTKPSIEIIEQGLFAGTVADEIAAALAETLAERGSASIVLSGGSTPAAIYRAMALPPRVEEVAWPKVKIFFGDERWVSQEDAQSNYRMVRETLLTLLPSSGPSVYPIKTDLGSVEQGATAYSKDITGALNLGAGEVPQFDIVLLGLGEDGHTASLFPGAESVNESKALVVAAMCGDQKRVSLTPPALLSAHRIFFIVSGASKANIVKEVIYGNATPQEFPARIFAQAKGKVTFFLDSAAGAGV